MRAGRTALALALASTALLVAAWIYATARDGFRLHQWLHSLELSLPASQLPAFVRFNLPDALWQYAFCVCVLAIWRAAPRSGTTWAFLALPVAIGGATELGQALGVVEGVADPLDAAGMAIAAIAAALTVGLPRRVWRTDPRRAAAHVMERPTAAVDSAPAVKPDRTRAPGIRWSRTPSRRSSRLRSCSRSFCPSPHSRSPSRASSPSQHTDPEPVTNPVLFS